ncbi:P22AR C-terminal domain-containing protein [Rodentibacter pneumotropicus]|uniref:P22AR C-terminal domain-containing protein n=1 Tax=Rodentibacter pneumotropicus TaxID=758 RepID=UPI00232CD932|nr:P22AR C-terminal domain-containing protein [Rodentibacter pneumotropicus]MDC2824584.1 P22AR C-terminal domain-containing protein [Rodentibacter pneumotropicus]
MTNLTIFNFENTPVQTIVENNEIFFRAAQLAELLQYSNPHKAIRDHVDPDDLTKREIVNTVNKRAQVLFVNESGMFSLVLSSKLESAKRVKRWVTSEVLPQIRKTGKYQLQPKQLALPEPEKKFTFEHSEYELQQLAWDWFALLKCVEFTSYILPALENIQSKFAAQASSIVSEYGSMLRRHQPLIQKLTTDFKVEMWSNENWNRVLPTIRDNDVLRPKRQLGKFYPPPQNRPHFGAVLSSPKSPSIVKMHTVLNAPSCDILD